MSETSKTGSKSRSPEANATVQNEEPSRAGAFRFKSRRKGSDCDEADARHEKRPRGSHESTHRRRKRHKSSRRAHNDSHAFQHPMSQLPPEQAFRESLFDALGDDEGAAFWEGVYGQPIHNYPDTHQNDETGELERMTDEEYAQFVRKKMWEKSWEGIEAAREEKRRERAEEKRRVRDEGLGEAADQHKRYDDHIFDKEIEASLRRGRKRKDRKRWEELWQDYLRRWSDLQDLAQTRSKADQNDEQLFLRNKIAWPVELGRRKDVGRDKVEVFVRKGTAASEEEDSTAFANAIKAERVRWHPDKIQQRYGFMEIDDDTLKGVTAVFQIFDAIWNDLRASSAL